MTDNEKTGSPLFDTDPNPTPATENIHCTRSTCSASAALDSVDLHAGAEPTHPDFSLSRLHYTQRSQLPMAAYVNASDI